MGKQPIKKTPPLNRPKARELDSLLTYQNQYLHYFNILYELYSTTFAWEDFPDYIYTEGGDLYLERKLTTEGKVLYFYDDVLNMYFLQTYTGSGLNFYQLPTTYTVSNSSNGYTRTFGRGEAVEILNSPYYTPENLSIKVFASKLALIDLTILLNVNSKKLPFIIKTAEGQRLTLENFLASVDSFDYNILVDNEFNLESLQILDVKSPQNENYLYELKNKIWNEALKYCGIGASLDKKERVITTEQLSSNGECDALLYTRYTTRQHACDEINKKFGLNVKVKLRTDINNRLEFLNSQLNEFFNEEDDDDGDVHPSTE